MAPTCPPCLVWKNSRRHRDKRLIPAIAYGIKMISMGLLVKPGQPLIWRGPMLNSAIRQFLGDVEWGELDYLIVDLPPGTGDASLSLAQALPLSGAVIVTLPQLVSLEDASRGLNMFRTLEVPILGIIENMSYLDLPDGTRMDIFGSGGGEQLAQATQPISSARSRLTRTCALAVIVESRLLSRIRTHPLHKPCLRSHRKSPRR